MYFSAISEEYLQGWRPYPNYLFAIAEWHLDRTHEPLDITARKLRKCYEAKGRGALLDNLRKTLYAGFAKPRYKGFQHLDARTLRQANPTLDAVAQLCERSHIDGGVRAVITENYDNLLEIALDRVPFQPIWNPNALEHGKLPIYHVHGYVPIEGEGSAENEIVFTEEQYHLAAQNAYSWSNLAQIQCMSSSVGLMVGLSMSDRNMRRLLDAVMDTPVRSTNFALLRRPQWVTPTDQEVGQIHTAAIQYFERFQRSGVKPGIKGGKGREEILGIIGQVERLDQEQQEFVLKQLGVHPIWYEDHSEVPRLLDRISRPR